MRVRRRSVQPECMPGRSPMGWPGRRGSPLKPFARGSEEGSNSASARGSEKATRWGFPGDAVARQAGESLCASSVVRKAAEPAKNRQPAARPECMPGGNRRPQSLPWQTVGAYPVTLRFGRRGSNYVSVCGPAG